MIHAPRPDSRPEANHQPRDHRPSDHQPSHNRPRPKTQADRPFDRSPSASADRSGPGPAIDPLSEPEDDPWAWLDQWNEEDRILAADRSKGDPNEARNHQANPAHQQADGRSRLEPETAATWQTTIDDFHTWQADLAYHQARTSLHDLLTAVDLTPRERQGLEPALAALAAASAKLDRALIQIAAFGAVGRGKSSLLNALLGRSAFATGAVHGVTRERAIATWVLPDQPFDVELVDTPGLDEVDGAERAALALTIARQVDLLLFVIAGDMTALECAALSELREAGKPILLVFNKADRYPAADRQALYETLHDRRLRQLLAPEDIVFTAAAPRIAQAQTRADGLIAIVWQAGPPQVADLKTKIAQVLSREGQALTALSALLLARSTQDRLVARKLTCRDRQAEQVIWQGALAKAAAVALNPITVLDLAGGAAIDVATILALSQVYGLSLSQTGAIKLLQTIALALGGLGASDLLVRFGLGALKTALGGATILTGGAAAVPYVAVAIAQAGVAGLSSIAIGHTAKTYFGNDASWGEASPAIVAQRILASLDEEAIIKRIEQELQAKFS